jgi:hypothetical protein
VVISLIRKRSKTDWTAEGNVAVTAVSVRLRWGRR